MNIICLHIELHIATMSVRVCVCDKICAYFDLLEQAIFVNLIRKHFHFPKKWSISSMDTSVCEDVQGAVRVMHKRC